MRFVIASTLRLFGLSLLLVTGVYSAVRQQPSDTLPWVIFISGDAYLYRMDADGNNLQRLSYTGHNSQPPQWIPDGIGFLKNEKEVRGYRVSISGTKQESITPPIRMYSAIAWSPDGRLVAFHDGFNLYSSDGKNPVQIPTPGGQKSNLSWSPDGQWLAFIMLDRPASYNLYIIHPDGSHLTRLTDDSGQNFYPAWSPDGQWIAFISNISDFGFQIHKIRPDGTDRQQLTHRVMVATFSPPSWSPDGRWIAFGAQRSAYDWNIYRVSSDGTIQEQLTDLRHQNRNPDWSPDGRWIVFQSHQGIYRMNPDGSQLQRLTDSIENAKYPIWSPRTDFAWHPLLLFIVGAAPFLIFLVYTQHVPGRITGGENVIFAIFS